MGSYFVTRVGQSCGAGHLRFGRLQGGSLSLGRGHDWGKAQEPEGNGGGDSAWLRPGPAGGRSGRAWRRVGETSRVEERQSLEISVRLGREEGRCRFLQVAAEGSEESLRVGGREHQGLRVPRQVANRTRAPRVASAKKNGPKVSASESPPWVLTCPPARSPSFLCSNCFLLGKLPPPSALEKTLVSAMEHCRRPPRPLRGPSATSRTPDRGSGRISHSLAPSPCLPWRFRALC